MMKLDTLKQLMKDETGATAIEYGLIAALVSVAAIGGMTLLGTSLDAIFNTVSGKLSAPAAAGGGTGG